MLTIKIMNFCISKLLKSRDEEQLECLCKLISTIGKTYEEEYDAKVSSPFYMRDDSFIKSIYFYF
jgi:translation initiation factor 4G